MNHLDIPYETALEISRMERKMKRYVVSSRIGVHEFDCLTIATNHAQLNKPATVWKGSDVTAYCTQAVTHWAGAEPIARIW